LIFLFLILFLGNLIVFLLFSLTGLLACGLGLLGLALLSLALALFL
jgi:hypothetical protein